MTVIILFCICVIAVAFCVILIINNAELKANNIKLIIENENLQYELGKTLINEKENELISKERIDNIKDKIKKTSKIKSVKQATKKDVEEFYKSQKENDTKSE